VAVPEAAVNQNDCVVPAKHYIGFTWQQPAVEPEAKSPRMQQPADAKFGARIGPANSAHHPAARRGIDDIRHCSAEPHFFL
jgi:hypothetical protein